MTAHSGAAYIDEGLSTVSLSIADRIAEAAGDGVSLAALEEKFGRYVNDKVTSLCRHGFVISTDRALDGDGWVFVMVVDPRDRPEQYRAEAA